MTTPISRRAFTGGVLLLPAAAFAQRSAGPGGGWIVHTDDVPNREYSLPELIESWVTPVDRFYVRSHAVTPRIDPAAYRLTVDGLVDNELSLSLEDLAAMPRVEATCTMTCAGNRRTEHSRTRTIKGVPWRAGAIGNATWGGVALADVLERAGMSDGATDVWFDGLDEIERGGQTIGFGASIPVSKVRESAGGVPGAIVCTSMNGEPLTPDHGYPVRTVVPGYIGARSVKWLGRIRAANRENPNHYQQTAYKVVREGSDAEWSERAPIYRFPINAVICRPRPDGGASGRITAAGYALPPGEPGVTVSRVEVSADAGNTWVKATLLDEPRPLCWVRWEAEVELPADAASLLVRAADTRGRQQPRSTPWNKKGYLFNAWHRVEL